MKTVSNGYKNQIKELGREIDSIITYYNHYKFITEDNQYILTEDGQNILTEQINRDSVVEITAEDIYNEKIITHGDILKTMMKEFDFEVKQEMQIGSIVNVKFGVKINGSYEYIDYGDFIVNQKEFNEDTKTYSYVAYDYMLFTMTPFKNPDLSEWSGEFTYYDLINYICEKCHLELGVELFANSDKEVDTSVLDSLEESNYTNRDVLDYVTELAGCSSWTDNNVFIISTPTRTKSYNLYDYTDINQKTTGIVTDDEGWITIEYNNTETTAKFFNYFTKNLNLIPDKNYLIVCEIAEYTYPQSSLNVISLNYSTPYQGQFTNGWNISSINLEVGTFIATRTASTYDHWRDNNYNNGIRTYFAVPEGQSGKIKFRLSVLEDTSITADTFKYEAYGDFYLNADSFKDTNVKFNEVFGPINSILLSRSEDTDVIEIKDDESISANGVTQIKIKDNPFLQNNDRGDYLEEMFDNLNGLTYSLNDVASRGITYLDYYDKYKVNIDNKVYDCLLLNDEIIINQGLEENIFTNEPEETTKEYRTSRLSDKDQKWANIQVKKDLGEISLEVGQISQDLDGKVGNNEIISKINLSPEQISISSNKLNLTGYITASDLSGSGTTTINGSNITTGSINANLITTGALKSANYVSNVSGTSISLSDGSIDTKNFKVSSDGSTTMSNATITGGDITIPEGIGRGVKVYATTEIGSFYTTQKAGGFSCYRDNKLMAQLHDGSTNAYGVLQLKDANETNRVTMAGSGYIRINNSSGTRVGEMSVQSNAGRIYLYNSSGSETVEIVGDNSVIFVDDVVPHSLETLKKNFEKFENALEIVKDTDIYKYNYKREEDTAKKRVGIVIGKNFNYREEITTQENNGPSLYSMISVLWQAVKEQQEEIEKLKERIDNK